MLVLQTVILSLEYFRINCTIVRTLREDQSLRLLLNLLFYHFNRSEPTYKSQRIKLLCNCRMQSIKCEYSKLDIDNNLFYFIEIKLLIVGNKCFSCYASQQHFSHVPLETEYNAVRVINYTILRG